MIDPLRPSRSEGRQAKSKFMSKKAATKKRRTKEAARQFQPRMSLLIMSSSDEGGWRCELLSAESISSEEASTNGNAYAAHARRLATMIAPIDSQAGGAEVSSASEGDSVSSDASSDEALLLAEHAPSDRRLLRDWFAIIKGWVAECKPNASAKRIFLIEVECDGPLPDGKSLAHTNEEIKDLHAQAKKTAQFVRWSQSPHPELEPARIECLSFVDGAAIESLQAAVDAAEFLDANIRKLWYGVRQYIIDRREAGDGNAVPGWALDDEEKAPNERGGKQWQERVAPPTANPYAESVAAIFSGLPQAAVPRLMAAEQVRRAVDFEAGKIVGQEIATLFKNIFAENGELTVDHEELSTRTHDARKLLERFDLAIMSPKDGRPCQPFARLNHGKSQCILLSVQSQPRTSESRAKKVALTLCEPTVVPRGTHVGRPVKR